MGHHSRDQRSSRTQGPVARDQGKVMPNASDVGFPWRAANRPWVQVVMIFLGSDPSIPESSDSFLTCGLLQLRNHSWCLPSRGFASLIDHGGFRNCGVFQPGGSQQPHELGRCCFCSMLRGEPHEAHEGALFLPDSPSVESPDAKVST